MLQHLAVSRGLPGRRVGGNVRRETLHFVRPARVEHGVHARSNAILQHLARIDHKIAHGQRLSGVRVCVQVGQSHSTEQRHLDRATPLRRPERRASWIETLAPALEHWGRLSVEPVGERLTPTSIEHRHLGDRMGQRPDVKPGPPHDERMTARAPCRMDCFARTLRPVPRRPSLHGFEHINADVRYTLAFVGQRLGRSNVEVAIDLSGVSADDRDRQSFRELHGDRRLSGGRRSADDTHSLVVVRHAWRGGHYVRPKRRSISSHESRTMVERP